MHSAVTCTAALATGTNRAVFSTSKVCQDALFIKHKYAQDMQRVLADFWGRKDSVIIIEWINLIIAQDDYNWMN